MTVLIVSILFRISDVGDLAILNSIAMAILPKGPIFEIAGTGKGVLTACQKLRKGGKRIVLSLIAYGFVVNDHASDFRVVAIFDLLAGLDVVHRKSERKLVFLVFVVDLLCGFLRLLLRFVHSDQLQLVRIAACHCYQLTIFLSASTIFSISSIVLYLPSDILTVPSALV